MHMTSTHPMHRSEAIIDLDIRIMLADAELVAADVGAGDNLHAETAFDTESFKSAAHDKHQQCHQRLMPPEQFPDISMAADVISLEHNLPSQTRSPLLELASQARPSRAGDAHRPYPAARLVNGPIVPKRQADTALSCQLC